MEAWLSRSAPLQLEDSLAKRLWRSSILVFLSLILHAPLVLSEYVADVPGDIILGGIFPLHEKNNYSCGHIRFDRGIQRAEAMLFALDKVNKDPTILPGIKLGIIWPCLKLIAASPSCCWSTGSIKNNFCAFRPSRAA